MKKEYKKTWDEATKKRWVSTMQEHQDADRLAQGSWLGEKKDGLSSGCFFGCAMQTSFLPLEKAIEDMKLPAWLIYLAEKIFEGLPREEALTFPVRLLEVIPTDACIEDVRYKLAILRLKALPKQECITRVIELHERWSSVTDDEWSSARSAAMSAARSAAESAARAAAESSARSAAESSARSAAMSAWSAAESAESAAWPAAEAAAWKTEANNLIKLLKKG